MKRLIAHIGYTDYLLASEADAVALLGIASRAAAVKQAPGDYTGPYYRKLEQEQFVERVELVDVGAGPMPLPQPEPQPAAEPQESQAWPQPGSPFERENPF